MKLGLKFLNKWLNTYEVERVYVLDVSTPLVICE